MFASNSVASRILFAFGTVITVFAAAIGLSLLRLSQFDRAVSDVTDVQLPKFQVSNSWTVLTMDAAIHMRNAVVTDDPSQVNAEIATVKQLSAKAQEYLDTLSAIVRTDDERARVAAVTTARNAYLPIEAAFLKSIDDGKIKDAREILLTRARGPQLAYLAKLTKLNEFFKASLTAHAQVLAESYQRTRVAVVAIAAGALVVAVLMVWWLARGIRNPLSQAVGVLSSIEQGRYDTPIQVRSRDETGQVLSALDTMQRSLKERIETERGAAQENARIRAALDRVAVGAMLADADGKIIYANDFAKSIFRSRAGQIRAQLPQFDAERIVGQSFDLFHRSAAQQRNLLSKLTGTHTADIKLGGATLRIAANPVLGGDGERLGTVVQWQDRTQEVGIEEEVQSMVAKAIEGDLTARIEEGGKEGFFKVLAQGMNRLTGNMAEVVRKMSQAAAEVRTGADEISRGNLNLSQRTEEQASSLEQTASSMEQMTAAVRNNADNASQANQLAAAAREQAERGGKVVGSAVAAMSQINVASNKIADIIGVIDEIAFQTNLLALNAAVEAARAGEQGRGFAVVASEVRNLASRSAQAAKQIKALIQDSVGKVLEGTKLVDESGRVLTEIVTGVKKVTDVVAEITASSREQAAGIEQVNKAVTAMDAVTQQNAALVEQASAAAQALTEQAANLTTLIERYRLGGEGSAPNASRDAPAAERRSAARPWSGAPKQHGDAAAKQRADLAPKQRAAAAGVAAAGSAPAASDQEWQDF